MNFLLYTKDNCPNCVSAKQLLSANNLPYVEVNVEDDPTALHALRTRYPEARQFPQIFVGNTRLGGLAGLQAFLNQPKEPS